jgi:hypothetical protein
MLRLLAGKLRPTEGKVEVFGRSPRRRAVKARIGHLAEQNGLAHRSLAGGVWGLVGRLVAIVAGANGGTPNERPQKQQPLARLVSALVNRPDLLLLDEPFDGVDSVGSEELKRWLLALARGGKTIVLSSHRLAELVGICDRVAVYSGGTVQAVGTFEELFSLPEAVCILAPVLSPTTSKRLVRVICEDLHCGTVPEEFPAGAPSTESVGVISNVPLVPALTPAPVAADEVLAPLVKPSCPAPPAEAPDKPSDSVDHKRLAELTRPGS